MVECDGKTETDLFLILEKVDDMIEAIVKLTNAVNNLREPDEEEAARAQDQEKQS